MPPIPKTASLTALERALAREDETRLDHANLEYLRDEFARTALEKCVPLFFSGLPEDRELGWPWLDYDDMARTCWSIADAMLRNRVKPETKTINFTGGRNDGARKVRRRDARPRQR